MQYRIYNSLGAPQCGVDYIPCATWEDVEAYFNEHPRAEEDLLEGYIRIEEVC